jgi:Protein of unknown function (DUF4242)
MRRRGSVRFNEQVLLEREDALAALSALAERAADGVGGRAGKIFCLVDAPSAEAANTVHREAHGLVADEIFQVAEGE